ncbi:jg3604 [Pararge aegeria aegeria]|uniref:Jg3604 protein n=1 Tax=Pararge aegeria aegeria TaxID=348720 RepID=A0A8S4RAY5_9NEOP|nr:jg3604 [Pararge aegeria aegeria]
MPAIVIVSNIEIAKCSDALTLRIVMEEITCSDKIGTHISVERASWPVRRPRARALVLAEASRKDSTQSTQQLKSVGYQAALKKPAPRNHGSRGVGVVRESIIREARP